MECIDNDLAQAKIYSSDGQEKRFSDLYDSSRVLIVFVRHFGCIFCRQRLGHLKALLSQFAEVNTQVAVIGNGTELMAQAFADDLNLDVPLYTDPKRETYRLAGMKRNFGLGPRSILNAARSWKDGYRQGAIAGDVWQQGGAMVVQTDAQVVWHQPDTEAGDVIDFEAIVNAIKLGQKS